MGSAGRLEVCAVANVQIVERRVARVRRSVVRRVVCWERGDGTGICVWVWGIINVIKLLHILVNEDGKAV